MRYIETVSKSPKNQKFIDTYFQESTFTKIAPYFRSDQTKPNQTKWYTTFCSSSCESLPKKISALQLHRGPRKLIRKFQNLKNAIFCFFLKKGPQGPPKRSKINSSGIFGYRGPKWPTKKIFGNFRDGGAKSVYMLTERRHITSVCVLKMSLKLKILQTGPRD